LLRTLSRRFLSKPPRTPRTPPGWVGKVDRNAELVAAFRAGASTAELADRYGISRQRVSQVIRKPDAGEVDRIYAERKTKVAEDRAVRDLWRRTHRCRACGAWFVGTPGQKQCSELCARAFKIARRYFDAEYNARLRGYQHQTGEPNRRYVIPGSEATEVLRAIGREDLLPAASATTRKRRQPPCAGSHLITGEPCKLTATRGDLCHIHAAAARGEPIGRGARRMPAREAS